MILKIRIRAKFKENLWCDKELEDKRNSIYYKEVVNPNLEDQNLEDKINSSDYKEVVNTNL
jgi:hypothetical protein